MYPKLSGKIFFILNIVIFRQTWLFILCIQCLSIHKYQTICSSQQIEEAYSPLLRNSVSRMQSRLNSRDDRSHLFKKASLSLSCNILITCIAQWFNNLTARRGSAVQFIPHVIRFILPQMAYLIFYFMTLLCLKISAKIIYFLLDTITINLLALCILHPNLARQNPGSAITGLSY